MQAFFGALIVVPIVLYVHAAGQTPHAHVTNWFLLALVLVAASMLTAALGLLRNGRRVGPRHGARSAQKYRCRRNCCYP